MQKTSIVSVNPPTSPVRWEQLYLFGGRGDRGETLGELGIGTETVVCLAPNPILITSLQSRPPKRMGEAVNMRML